MIFDDITYYSYMDCISDLFGNTEYLQDSKNYGTITMLDGEFQEIHNHIGDILIPLTCVVFTFFSMIKEYMNL